MTEARIGYVATRLESGQVLVAGGNGALAEGGVGPLTSSEIYDPRAGSWSFAGTRAALKLFGLERGPLWPFAVERAVLAGAVRYRRRA